MLVGISALVVYAAASALMKLREVNGGQYLVILEGAGSTFLRVNLALLLVVMSVALFVTARSFTRPLSDLARTKASISASLRTAAPGWISSPR